MRSACLPSETSPLVYSDDGPLAQIRRSTMKNEMVHSSFHPPRRKVGPSSPPTASAELKF
ncbi:unnamed protein product [Gulo gulo]|uniref:Uncharacterized protein n=1 Tax=Gulo gulo TaxID=48420 RepID=A0A9X9MBL8_GULGU|nr:unnamed protein product [Gulo gulo]